MHLKMFFLFIEKEYQINYKLKKTKKQYIHYNSKLYIRKKKGGRTIQYILQSGKLFYQSQL